MVILSKLEQEYLLRIVEAGAEVRGLRDFFLWSGGQLQTLLPHALMVCVQFDQDGAVLRVEALHGSVLGSAALARLCDPDAGLAPRLLRHYGGADALPAMADAADPGNLPLSLQHELAACGFDNVVLHGTGPVGGGGSGFVLFGLPHRPETRHLHYLSLLLPQLHLALARLGRDDAVVASVSGVTRPMSPREAQVLHYLREGKTNAEIGAVLGLSELTVKNHLQRMYKLLGVRNRTEAVARCLSLRLAGRR